MHVKLSAMGMNVCSSFLMIPMDVMLLLLHFLSSVETWMVSGTTKKRKCYPIHAIGHTLSNDIRDNLLSFHALTGCDTSSFHGHGKKSCWKAFVDNPHLVHGVGRPDVIMQAEQFVCNLYGTPEVECVDHARFKLFVKAKKG